MLVNEHFYIFAAFFGFQPRVRSLHAAVPFRASIQMRDPPGGSEPLLRISQFPERSAAAASGEPHRRGAGRPSVSAPTSCPSPADPSRQAKRLPIRIIKMLTAHGGHLLHPEYLQPLTSAPVSIEVSKSKERSFFSPLTDVSSDDVLLPHINQSILMTWRGLLLLFGQIRQRMRHFTHSDLFDSSTRRRRA